jgi:hypothetical protein
MLAGAPQGASRPERKLRIRAITLQAAGGEMQRVRGRVPEVRDLHQAEADPPAAVLQLRDEVKTWLAIRDRDFQLSIASVQRALGTGPIHRTLPVTASGSACRLRGMVNLTA